MPTSPGVFRGARWRAIYVAPPPEGVTFRVTLRIEDEAAVSESRVAVVTPGLPGGAGPQGLAALAAAGAGRVAGADLLALARVSPPFRLERHCEDARERRAIGALTRRRAHAK